MKGLSTMAKGKRKASKIWLIILWDSMWNFFRRMTVAGELRKLGIWCRKIYVKG